MNIIIIIVFLQQNRSTAPALNLVSIDRWFSEAAPTVYNKLSQHIITDLYSLKFFKRLLNTELYDRAYHC